VTVLSSPSYGTAVVGVTGITYTHDSSENFADSFTYEIADGAGGSDSATVDITVTPVNDEPVAVDDTAAVAEGDSVEIDVLANDTDSDSTLDYANVTVLSSPSYGTALVGATGITYSHDSTENFTDSFIYEISDGAGGSDTATVDITITPVNDESVAVDDTAAVTEGDSTEIDVLANDTDSDSTLDYTNVTVLSSPTFGTAVVGATGITYTHDSSENFTDSFTYEIADGAGGSDIATVVITVNADNDAPVANDDSATTNEDVAVTVDVLANDTDIEGDTLAVVSVTLPGNGTAVDNGDGTITYTPDLNFTGTDAFSYHASDGLDDSNIATVTITVNSVNDAPVAVDDNYTTDEDTTLVIAAPGILGNDSDADGDALIASPVSGLSNGSAVVGADGSISYTPDANFHGTDSFTYVVNDGTVDSNIATVTITVNSVNDAPVAVDDNYTTDEDTTLVIAAPGILGNDSDADGDALIASPVSGLSNGSAVVGADGSISYTPDANFHGTDSFTYVANDGTADSNIATVTITVNSVNDAPVANDDSATTNEDTPVNVDVLANDTDVDDDTLFVDSIAAQPANGSVVINADDTLTYTPDPDYNGADSFTYTASDGNGGFDTATVTVTVNAINDAPIAADDSIATNEDTPITYNVLANDTDIDGDTLAVASVIQGTNGTVSLNVDNTVTYAPNANYNGSDSFTYSVIDGQGGIDTATVNVTVIPVNDAPVANDDDFTTVEDTLLGVAAPGVLANDSDMDGDSLTASLVADVSNGTLTFHTDGSFDYLPNADFNGIDSFTYVAIDGEADSNEATVTIEVSADNDAPVAVNDHYAAEEDTALVIDAPGVLSNDTDVENDFLFAILETEPAHGILVLQPDGSFTYTPDLNFSGTDTFTYLTQDEVEISAPATVTITIGAINDIPVANDDSYLTDEDTPLVIAAAGVLGNDTDADGNPLTAVWDAGPADGTLILNSDGSYTYTPDLDFNGTDAFSYHASDGLDDSNIATVTIVVRAENDAPDAVDDAYTTAEDTTLTVFAPGVLDNDSDVEGDPLTAVLVTATTHGTLTFNAGGHFNYVPDPDFHGADTFTYLANDGTDDSALAFVRITVTSVNDIPVAQDDSYVIDEDTALTILAPGILANDTDADGDTLTVGVAGLPSFGSLNLNADGSFTYTPDPNAHGTEIFGYDAYDGTAHSNFATITITVNPVNDAPLAVDDSYTTGEDTSLTVALPGVLNNDIEHESDPLSAVMVNGTADGTLTMNADGSFSYSPDPDFHGSDSFTYMANDGLLDSNLAAVSITVTSVNDDPIADANGPYVIDAGDDLILDGSGSLDPDSAYGDSIVSYQWDMGSDGSYEYTGVAPVVPWADLAGLPLGVANSVSLRVTDSFGASGTDTTTLSIYRNEPLAVMTASPNPAAYGQLVTFDGSASSHGRPDRSIVQYEWDFDYDGASFTTDATGVTTTHAYALFGTYTAALRVTDDNTPARADIATVVIDISLGNQVPVADANGSYVIDEGTDLVLDGSGSVDPDAAAGDSIVAFEWDMGSDSSYEYTGVAPVVPWADLAGLPLGVANPISLRVTDSFGASTTDTTTLSIYDNEPAAAMTANPNPAAPGQIITFDGSASYHNHAHHSIVSYEWDFDYDGITFNVDATGVQVTNTYGQFGSYIAALRVADDNVPALTDETTLQIDINQGNSAPVSDPNGPYVINEGADLQLDGSGSSDPNTAAGDSIVLYEWDIGVDGTFDYAGVSPTVPWADLAGFALATPHTVQLRVTDSFGATGTDSTTVSIYRNEPVAEMTASPNPAAYGQPVTFDGSASSHGRPDRSIVQYEWDFDYDGSTFTVDATGATVTNAYALFGSYTAALQVTDDNTPAKTDMAMVVIDISLGNQVPVADANGPYVIDEGADLVLDGSGSSDPDTAAGDSIVSYEWDIGGDGSYEYTGVAPVVPWADLAGLPLGVANPLRLRVTDSFGATDTASTTLTIYRNQPVAVMTANPNPAAPGQSITFDGSGSYNDHASHDIVLWEWDFDYDGSTFDVDASGVTAAHAYSLFGTYTAALRVTDDNTPTKADIATVVIDISLGNQAPVADANGPYVIDEGDDLVLDGSGSVDPDTAAGDSIISYEWDIGSDGSYEYTGVAPTVPWADLAGLPQGTPHAIALRATDSFGISDIDTTTLTINPLNTAPVANDDAVTTDEDTTVTVNVLANDNDADGDSLTAISFGFPANGTVQEHGDGTVTYVPDHNFNGSDSFSYTIADGNGGEDRATVNITVRPVNDAPVAVNDTITTNEDTPIAYNVLVNDFDVDGDTLTVASITNGANGIVQINADNTVTYSPNSNFNGADIFTYIISDGSGGTDTGTVSVTVSPVNDAPVAFDDSGATDEEVSLTIAVLANDFDVDGDALSLYSFSQPLHGVTVLGVDDSVAYTPNPNYFGSDTLTYTVSDGNGGFDTATVSITVRPVNDAPVAVDDNVTTTEDTWVSFDVRTNDEDVDGDALGLISVSDPAHGTAVIDTAGTALDTGDDVVAYTPDPDYNGLDSFTYTISDGNGGEATGTVNITVTPVNDAPVANADAITTSEDTSITYNVLSNDSDIDGDALVVSSVTNGANGTVQINADNTVVYSPNSNFNGTDSFTYIINDGSGGTDTSIVSVTVSPVNDAPVANDDGVATDEDVSLVIAVLANDFDVDGDAPSMVSFSQPAHGVAVLGVDNSVAYTPDPNYFGPDSFTYTISDGNGGEATGTVNIAVTPVNDAPEVYAGPDQDAYEGYRITVDAEYLDADVAGPYTASIDWGDGVVDAPSASGGYVTGDHQYAEDGIYTVTVTVTDDDGAAGSDTLTVTVENLAPEVHSGPGEIGYEGDALQLIVAHYEDRGSLDTHTATIDWGDGLVEPAEAAGGIVSADHVYTDDGVYAVEVTVTDDEGASGSAIKSVTVYNVAPQVYPVPEQSGYEGSLITVSADYEDRGSADTHTANIDWGDGVVDTHAAAGGSLSVDHRYADDGYYEVTVTVTDDDGASNSIITSVTVYNDAPQVDAGNDLTGDEGVAVTVDAGYFDPGSADTHTATIDWGDGTAEAAATNDGNLTGTHVYADNGDYTVTVLVIDDDDTGGIDTLNITVRNRAPEVQSEYPHYTEIEGYPISVRADYDDVNADRHVASIDWGDGTTEPVAAVGGSVTGTHVYADNGEYKVTVTVTDDDGGSGSDTLIVTVDNVAPEVDAGPDQSGYESLSIMALSVDYSDRGSADTHTATIDWGDGVVDTPAAAGGSMTAYHQYADDGIYTVTVTVTDDDGASGSDTATATVENIAPEVDAVDDQTGFEGFPITVFAGYSDIGSLDTHTASIDWGDGMTDAAAVDGGQVTGAHAYTDNGEYTVTVTVTDDEGASGSDTLIVTVINVAPVVDAVEEVTGDEGVGLTVNASYSDSGSADTHTATIDWGDGVVEPAGAIGGIVSADHVYADNSFYTVIVTVTDDDGGSSSAEMTVIVNNVAPTAADDTAATDEDTPVFIDVLANDSDVAGDTLSLFWVNYPLNGTAEIQAAGTMILYTPHPDFSGIDSFGYTVSDDDGGRSQGELTVTVNPVNDPPTLLIAGDQTVDEDSGTQIVDGFDRGFYPGGGDDEADQTLVEFVLSNDNNALFSVQPHFNEWLPFSYTPAPNAHGQAVVTIQARDSGGTANGGEDLSAPLTFTITVTPVNDAPVAVDDLYAVEEDTALVVDAPGVLSNDNDVENDPLFSILEAEPANGILVLQPDGSFTYTPDLDFTGSDSFVYHVSDGSLNSLPATVMITVNSVNDDPISDANGPYVIDFGDDLTLDASGSSDPDEVYGDAIVLYEWDIDSDGSFDYAGVSPTIPWADLTGFALATLHTIQLRVTDSFGASNTASTTLSIYDNEPVAAMTATPNPAAPAQLITFDGSASSHGRPDHSIVQYEWDFDYDGSTFDVDAGEVQVIHAYAQFGAYTVALRVTDDNTPARTDLATVVITINQGNQAPVSDADGPYLINEGEDLLLDGSGSSDPNATAGDAIVLYEWDLGSDGSYEYSGVTPTVPWADLAGLALDTPHTIGLRVTDTFGLTDTDTTTLTVNSVNDAPLAVDDAYSTDEDTLLTVAAPGMLANDSDADGDGLTLVVLTTPQHGSGGIGADGSFSYTPDADWHGVDTFTYQASDGIDVSNIATVTITVNSVNDAPLAVDDAYSTDEDTLLTVAAPGMLANDSDADGDVLTLVLLTTPQHGSGGIGADASFSYTPDADWHGVDTFTYQASDGTDVSNIATVTITVNSVNDAPLAVDDAYSTDEDTLLTVAAPGMLANDSDADGDSLTLVLLTTPQHGSGGIGADGSFSYTPDADWHGTDSFTYQASDGTDVSNIATVTITVNSVNDAPLAVDDAYSIDEDTLFTVAAPGMLANDSDADGDELTLVLLTTPQHGSGGIGADGSFSYTPDADWHGVDTFTYQASDGTDVSNIATVTITVNSVNDAPLAVDDTYSTDEDTTLVIAWPGILGNDSDNDGDALTANPVTGPVNGAVAVGADGSITYTPDANFHGTDSFTYVAHDGTVDSNAATVTIEVSAVNDTPVANDDTATTDEDTKVTIDVLANDSDADEDTLVVASVTQGTNGTVSINADDTVTYTPDADYNGGDSFTYTVSDGQGGADTAAVNVTVTPVNNVPVAHDDTYSIDEDQTLTVSAPGILGNDSDADGDSLSVSTISVVGAVHGSLVVSNQTGAITFTPDADFHGNQVYEYTATDGTVDSNPARITITVNSVNDAPVANDDHMATNEDTSVLIPVLDNDSDVDGDALSLGLLDITATVGLVTVNADNTLTYDPNGQFEHLNAGDTATDTFIYTASDGNGGSDTATVTVTIQGVNGISPDDINAGDQADDGAADVFVIVRNGDDIDVSLNGALLLSLPYAGAPQLVVNGSSDDDTLIVDFSGGDFIGDDGIVFNGGPGADNLRVVEGMAGTVAHTLFDATSGIIDIDGDTITYTGLEPIVDTLAAVNRIFTFATATADEISLGDNGTPGDNISRISSVLSSETVDFLNPAGSLTINAGDGDDTVTISQLDNGASGAIDFDVAVNGQKGDLLIGGIDSGSEGHLAVTSDGAITAIGGAVIIADTLEARAGTGMVLHTQIAELLAQVRSEGILAIYEADTITLTDVTNTDGPIYVIAGGSITADRVASLADAKGNNVGLMSLDGDILVDYIGVGVENGQISLSSADDILEANADPEVDLRGALGIFYAQGKIDKGLDRSFKPIHQHGKKKHHGKKWHHGRKEALCEFEGGKKLMLSNVQGDVELFFSLANKVDVSATGDIHVVYLDSHGHDIDLKSRCGDIHIEYLNAGPGKGDITLKVDNLVYLAGQLYSGDTGQIIAGDDLEIYAGGDIRLFGSVSAGDDIRVTSYDGEVYIGGPVSAGDDIDIYADDDLIISAAVAAGDDVNLDSGGELEIYAVINSLDDVKIWADEGIFVDAAITSVDNIEIGTSGDLTTTDNAPLGAGNDIEIYAGGTVRLGAEVTAGGDIRIDSWDGDVLIAGSIAAGEAIDVDADENLIISAALYAGGDLDLYARYNLTTTDVSATLTAGAEAALETRCGNIALGGAVSAVDGSTASSSKHCKGHKEIPGVSIDSGAELYIHAAITSQDDVKIKSEAGIFIEAAITAADEIEIESGDSLIATLNAVLNAGDDLELKAKGVLNIGAALIAGDDVKLDSHSDVRITGNVRAGNDVKIKARDDIEVAGTVEAYDRIELSAKDNLTLLAGSILGGIDGQKARKVYLRAGGDLTRDGTIHAEKLSIR